VLVEYLKWCHLSGYMEGSVVPPLCQWKPLEPMGLFIKSETTNIPLKTFPYDLGLTILYGYMKGIVIPPFFQGKPLDHHDCLS
jgi:hypothetical protein